MQELLSQMDENVQSKMLQQAGGRVSVLFKNLQQLPKFKKNQLVDQTFPATEEKMEYMNKESQLWTIAESQLEKKK